MDFPLPIRSFTSTTDFSTPLFVETNIVYKMDETKFPGLHECSHFSEPALIMDSNNSLNSCNTWTELCDISEGGNEDLDNIIDSWVVPDVVFPSVDDMLDLPDIQQELPTVHVNGVNQLTLPSACVNGESTPHPLSSNFTETQNDTTISPLCESCRFSNPALKRKRNVSFSFHQDITNYSSIEDLTCSKRRKSETDEFNLTNNSLDNCFENVIDYIFPQRQIYPGDKQTTMFHFGLSPIKSLNDRQW